MEIFQLLLLAGLQGKKRKRRNKEKEMGRGPGFEPGTPPPPLQDPPQPRSRDIIDRANAKPNNAIPMEKRAVQSAAKPESKRYSKSAPAMT
ncbi:MAG: hypothetical protein VCD16_08325, partial [Planctomycetota bacterium]